jgi:cytochrome P450
LRVELFDLSRHHVVNAARTVVAQSGAEFHTQGASANTSIVVDCASLALVKAMSSPFNPAAGFSPSQLGELEDPYPMFDLLRGAGPLVVTSDGLRVVTSYAAADETLRDKRFRSGPIAERFRRTLPAGAAQDELAHRINFLDAPDHQRVRGLIQRAFTPRRVQDMRPWVERKAEALLDAIEAQSRTGDDDSFDIRADLAHSLPSLVISEMLGVPLSDRDRLTEWTEAVTPLLGLQVPPDQMTQALHASEQFAAYAAALIATRRATPGDDLLTAMLQVKDGNEQLSREELLSLVVTLYSAGHRTTRDLFTNGLYILLQHTEMYAAIVKDAARAPRAIDEFLRYETPTLYVARIPTENAEIAGVPVPAYSPVIILLAAANRDPERFRDPNSFDIERDEGPPLSFAAGPHHCLGAALARMEAEVMLLAVTRRWPKLAVAGPPPTWWSSGPFRGLSHLNVRSVVSRNGDVA